MSNPFDINRNKRINIEELKQTQELTLKNSKIYNSILDIIKDDYMALLINKGKYWEDSNKCWISISNKKYKGLSVEELKRLIKMFPSTEPVYSYGYTSNYYIYSSEEDFRLNNLNVSFISGVYYLDTMVVLPENTFLDAKNHIKLGSGKCLDYYTRLEDLSTEKDIINYITNYENTGTN